MPSWKIHEKVGEIDGIKKEVMRKINEMIDIFHIEKCPGINPEQMEWKSCTILISDDALLAITDEKERIEYVKAALHHYILDFVEKTKIADLEMVEEVGLTGLRNHLKSYSEDEYTFFPFYGVMYGFIERWYHAHREEDVNKFTPAAKNLAKDLENFFTEGIFPPPMSPKKNIAGYYECWKCGYSCSPEIAERENYICPKCGDILHEC